MPHHVVVCFVNNAVSPMTKWTCYIASSAFKVLCLPNFIMPICLVYGEWHKMFFFVFISLHVAVLVTYR